METHDVKETWKAGVEKNIKPYPEKKLNEMVIKSTGKSTKTVYPRTTSRLVMVVVVVYLIITLSIREWGMGGAYVDIAALAVLSISYFPWEHSAHRIRKYTNGMTVEEWLEHRIKKVEKDTKLSTKYGWVVYTRSFLSVIGFHAFYLMAMNITPGMLNVMVISFGIAIYLLIIDRSLGRNYRRALRELKDLYEQLEVEDWKQLYQRNESLSDRRGYLL